MSPRLIEPDKTSSFSAISFASLSPVRADTSKIVFPFITFPSTGIFSPCFIINISPIFISSTLIFSKPFLTFLFA